MAVATLAVCFNASRASAQDFHGKFTLPIETRWGAATLPPGEYSLTVDHEKVGCLVLISSPKRNLFVLPATIEARQLGGESALFAVRSAGTLNIRSLYVEQLSLFLGFPAPKGGLRVMAQAPQLIQRVPIAAGK